jgi:acyl-CoA synthetase (AMP-forming)/AMP-acid ligase II
MEAYESILTRGGKREPGVKIGDDDVMNIIFTAGTTGMSKGAMRTHRHITTNATAAIIEMKISYEERVLISYPMYHVAFDDHVCRHSIMANTTVIRREGSFDAEEVLEILSRNRITMCQFVPTMINALLQSRDIDKYDLSCLRLMLYTAAPMRIELLKRALQKFKCGFAQLYGQTESGPFTAMLRPEDHVLEGSERELQKLASVGRPVVDYEIRIVDEEGKDVQVGEVGEIIVKSEAMMKGYWQLPEETEEKLKEGWLHTGDLGKFDEDGYLYLVDRKNNLIISGGKNIYPREVEDILYQHPMVLEAAVVGIPDDYWGEAVKAIVVLKKGAAVSEEEIIRFCREHLASYKKPKSVEFWGELPKNVQGKILKRVIRERYWKDTGRMI